jgi:hypothetical protein
MLAKIKKLFSDNSLRALLSGNMVITEGIINEFAGRLPLPAPMKRASVLCREGIIEVEGEGELEGLKFSFAAAVQLLGVRFSAREQVLRLMPAGPVRFATPNLDLTLNLRPGPGLLDEIKTALKFAPADQTRGLVIESDSILLNLHENPLWAEQFSKQIRELPIAKKFGINPLDYVTVNDIRIEPGAVRLLTQRT